MADGIVDPDSKDSSPLDNLSNREAEVLALVVSGLSNLEIARYLQISPETIKTYIASIYLKLNVHNRAEAVALMKDADLTHSEEAKITHSDEIEPEPARMFYLQSRYDANRSAGHPPYKNVEFRTEEELLWILLERGWTDYSRGVDGENADLRGALFIGMDITDVQLSKSNLADTKFQNIRMSKVNLSFSDFNRAVFVDVIFNIANLVGVNLTEARFKDVKLNDVMLNAANLSSTVLNDLDFSTTTLQEVNLSHTALEKVNLSGLDLTDCNLSYAGLDAANLVGTKLAGATLSYARVGKADLSDAILDGADLSNARLRNVTLRNTSMVKAILYGANLENANLDGADLREVEMDTKTNLMGITLSSTTQMRDIQWNGATLTRIDWTKLVKIGDENSLPPPQNRQDKIVRYRDATRAYRGLSLQLRSQGLLIPASRYRLREQRLEKHALRLERKYGAWLFSNLIDLVAAYGEAPGRAFVAYLMVIATFSAIFWYITNFLVTQSSPLQWYEALILSLSSFHGRGFFPSTLSLGDPLAIVAAFEAVIGLFIELIFIATFSRRFLGN